MKVMKFGGTSLASGERIQHVSRIIGQFHEQDEVVIVASAMQGVTDKLINLFNLCQMGMKLEADELRKTLRDFHFLALDELQLHGKNNSDTCQALNALFKELEIALTETGNYDYVISFGERLSTYLLSAAVNNSGFMAKPIMSSDIIVVNDSSEHLDILMVETKLRSTKVVAQLHSQNIIPIVTGFFAVTQENKVVTLGRGGSDFTATILADALDANEVILWKDVNGVYGHDPKKDPNAALHTDLSYGQATLLAQNGAKVLHADCLNSVSSKEIVVWVKNTFNPLFRGTRISNGNLL